MSGRLLLLLLLCWVWGCVAEVRWGTHDQHELLRCAWGTSFSRRTRGEANLSGVASDLNGDAFVPVCDPAFCSSAHSTYAYGRFLFDESVFFHREVSQPQKEGGSKQRAEQAFRRMLTYKRTQCLFYRYQDDLSSGAPCQCVYPSFSDFCTGTQHSVMQFLGDSTANKLAEDLVSACSELSPSGVWPQPAAPAGPKVVVLNEATLHHLYLPFARETDVAARQPTRSDVSEPLPGHWGGVGLLRNITSVGDYLDVLSQAMKDLLDYNHPGTIFVYMANNEVCPMAYTGAYKESWRFLMEDMNAPTLMEIAARRKADLSAVLGFTLDHYGTSFVSRLIRAHLFSHYTQFLYLPFTPTYPGTCELTLEADGRHFGEEHYRLAKGRVLWHLVKPHIFGRA